MPRGRLRAPVWLQHDAAPFRLCLVLLVSLSSGKLESEGCVKPKKGEAADADGVVIKFDGTPKLELLASTPFVYVEEGDIFCHREVAKACSPMNIDDVFVAHGNFAPDDGSPTIFAARGSMAPSPGLFCKRAGDVDVLHHLGVSPSWRSFAGFDVANGKLIGALSVEYYWLFSSVQPFARGTLPKDVSPPHLADVTNFDGSGKVNEFPTYDAIAVPNAFGHGNHLQYGSTISVYSGSFAQRVDGYCAPFDIQDVEFDLRLPAPYHKEVQFRLGCAQNDRECKPAYVCSDFGDYEACPPQPENLTTLQHVRYEGEVVNGYKWSALTCQKHSTRHIVCKMQGARQVSKALLVDIVPGAVMTIISFASFLLPNNMAMPRVATTMIALLTFVNKGSSVMSKMPSKGMSIIEEFYIFGVVVMLINLLGHIVSFAHPAKATLVSDLQLGLTSLSFALFLTARLHSRTCNFDLGASTGIIVIVSLMLALALLRSLHTYRHSFTDLKRALTGTYREDE